MTAPLDEDGFCRLVIRAHLGLPGARDELREALGRDSFPWYHGLAVLHRQGLRPIFASLAGDCVPANVSVKLQGEAELAEAIEVVVEDRIRRVRSALTVAGLEGAARVRAEDDRVIVVAGSGRAGEVRRALEPLGVGGPRPVDGRVNRLAPPAIQIVDEGTAAPAVRWRQVLDRASAAGKPLDETTLAATATPAEPRPEPPVVLPPPTFLPPERAAEILAIRLGGIGDVLFALPALRAVRDRYPGARLTLLADTAQRDHLLARSGCIDAVEPFDWDLRDPEPGRRESARRRFAELASRSDLLVVFGPIPAVADIDHGAPVLELRAAAGGGHTACQLLEGVGAAGIDIVGAEPVPALAVSVDERRHAGERLSGGSASRPHPWVALVPGATTIYKMWPIERFAELATSLQDDDGATVFTFPSRSEASLARELVERAPQVVSIEKVPILELSPLLAACDLVVGNDTGPTHLAAALGVPTLALYGFTDPGFTAPLGPRVETLGGIPNATPGCEERIRDLTVTEVLEKQGRSFPFCNKGKDRPFLP